MSGFTSYLFRFPFVLLLFIAVAVAEPPVPRADTGMLHWIDGQGATTWSVSIPASEIPADSESRPLLLPSEYEQVPDLKVRVLDGDPIALSPSPGKVLLLDFWASWCKPCMMELPHLRELYGREKENGLVAIAVNVDEPDEVARRAADRIGLRMPVGLHDPELDRALQPRTLPTLVVADGEGRIRGRWDGYMPGVERAVERLVRGLLADGSVEPKVAGRAWRGGELLEIRWHKKLESRVDGIAAFEPAPGERGIAVSHRPSVTFLLADGTLHAKLQAPAGTAEIVSGDITGDGVADLVGFRSGQPRIGIVDIAGKKLGGLTTPGKVRAAAVLPAGKGEGTIHLATDRGLIVAGPGGNLLGGTPGRYLDVVADPGAGPEGIVALSADGTVRRGPAGGAMGKPVQGPPGTASMILVPSVPGIGLAGGAVTAMAAGRFLENGRQLVAVADSNGHLALLEPSDGTVLYEARFPGIRRMAAIDLDADGRDELMLGIGHRLIVLGSTEAQAAESVK